MKTIVVNASPRKNWNTAELLKEAKKGAESVGAETEYVDLYDLNFTGCRSCLACKRKGAQPCKCYWKDELSPVLESIFHADALLIGSPIYLGTTTSHFHAITERLDFASLSYNDYACLVEKPISVGIFLTMNMPKEYYVEHVAPHLQTMFDWYKRLGGKFEVSPCCDTLQVKDYSKYDMASFNEAHKKEVREKQFPIDLKEAFRIGAEFSREDA